MDTGFIGVWLFVMYKRKVNISLNGFGGICSFFKGVIIFVCVWWGDSVYFLFWRRFGVFIRFFEECVFREDRA